MVYLFRYRQVKRDDALRQAVCGVLEKSGYWRAISPAEFVFSPHRHIYFVRQDLAPLVRSGDEMLITPVLTNSFLEPSIRQFVDFWMEAAPPLSAQAMPETVPSAGR